MTVVPSPLYMDNQMYCAIHVSLQLRVTGPNGGFCEVGDTVATLPEHITGALIRVCSSFTSREKIPFKIVTYCWCSFTSMIFGSEIQC